VDTSTLPPRQVTCGTAWPLFDVHATRALERAGLAATAGHALMQRAGLATARLAMALQPHAQTIWVAAGPGNNGGDGIEAALHLHRWGKNVVVTWLGNRDAAPADAKASFDQASAAGVRFADDPPDDWDMCIDALLGIGATREPQGTMAQWIVRAGQSASPVLSIDVPTGLDADTGVATQVCVKASATLCLLTVKPGLFTADGRDATQQVWLDDLQLDTAAMLPAQAPTARLNAVPRQQPRQHASHKGSFGDVAVVGGATGMAGAALLAALGALHSGAGRVLVCPLDDHCGPGDSAWMPEFMRRNVDQLDLQRLTVVCGCGGGDAVRFALPRILTNTARLVLDADALNTLAREPQMRLQLRARAAHAQCTVLTPHPLEAARLLGTTTHEVQGDRLAAARQLALDFQCVVVLKGSGTVIAASDQTPAINPTGNPRLAMAGSGDVLAGMVGAALAAGAAPFEAACSAVYRHGAAADDWDGRHHLTAAALARSLR
jgi:hydroxyethylthiazole kinase-like uncharacterized protein yjeF